ncbi:MAG: ORF6N domain-containing protein [Alphaproteobacteria bacterium]|nr:ORF6N domain-containing protein [Alphaproteobacteria bacterium]
MTLTKAAVPLEGLIRVVRGQKVMLDSDLADLYEVKPIALRQQVKRNSERFPSDFMFRLSADEADALVSQSVIPSRRNFGGFLPFVFTQEGIAMLSSVLRSLRAVEMNILIMRAFVRLRQLMITHKEFAARIDKLERGHEKTGSIIEILVEDIDNLAKEIHWIKNPPLPRKHPIGFAFEKKSEK